MSILYLVPRWLRRSCGKSVKGLGGFNHAFHSQSYTLAFSFFFTVYE